jgi:hypothetical protein
MEKFLAIGPHLIEKIRDQFGNAESVSRKKWIAYAGLLIVSFVLFLTLGGSKPGSTIDVPAGNTEMLIGGTFREMSDRLVGMGEPDRPGIDWEEIPEGLDPVYESWGRDPFAFRYRDRMTTLPLRKSDLSLSAISWRGDEAVILINDSVLKKGDLVDGAEVLEIFMNSVVLRRDDKQIVLKLNGAG